MADKPATASAYRSEHAALVRATCLYVATKLGDLMEELVVVGGLVPSLLVEQDKLPTGAQVHVGTITSFFGGPGERRGDGKKETWKATVRGRAREPVRERGAPWRCGHVFPTGVTLPAAAREVKRNWRIAGPRQALGGGPRRAAHLRDSAIRPRSGLARIAS